MSRLTAASSVEPAKWAVAGLGEFANTVTSIVPAGFVAYVRVFHPAYRRTSEGLDPVRWAEIAEANGTQAHPAMQLIPLTRDFQFLHQGQPGVYDQPPIEGSLPGELAKPLANVLARHTTTPNHCWFAVWVGFGDLRSDIRAAPVFHVPPDRPKRSYHLLRGSLDAIEEQALNYPHQLANLWWPDDRAWCVATEIDFNTTYIGCSDACRDEILALAGIEATPIDASAGVIWRSDSINPWPGEDP